MAWLNWIIKCDKAKNLTVSIQTSMWTNYMYIGDIIQKKDSFQIISKWDRLTNGLMLRIWNFFEWLETYCISDTTLFYLYYASCTAYFLERQYEHQKIVANFIVSKEKYQFVKGKNKW